MHIRVELFDLHQLYSDPLDLKLGLSDLKVMFSVKLIVASQKKICELLFSKLSGQYGK